MKTALLATLLGSATAFSATPEAREWKSPDGTTLKYRWHAPETIEPGKTYPLVLFLHGAGERGTDNTAQLKHGVNAILKGAEKLKQPCFLIAPQCPADRWWAPINRETMRLSEAAKPNPLLESVLALVSETMKQQPVDPKRFYVTGISMGGYATWDSARPLAGHHRRRHARLRRRRSLARFQIQDPSPSTPSTARPIPWCPCARPRK
jgi:predicted peptidase